MAKVKNVSGSDLTDGYANRLVLAGAVVEVADELLWNYTQCAPGQTGRPWAPGDKRSQAIHDAAYAKYFPEAAAESAPDDDTPENKE